MANKTALRSIHPKNLNRNPENPRLIFRADDLSSLEESIKSRGILVPLTVYEDGAQLYILDGERRWRCALRLNLESIPVIVQPKPGRMQNIMMMFAIHNARRDWDPLPTAYKLHDLEKMFFENEDRYPTEAELAELASISRGEVRRLKKLLALPEGYRDELMAELEKPRAAQRLTVDHVLEATKGAEALKKRGVINDAREEVLRSAIVEKFRSRVLNSTVEPRKLSRIARAVERQEISLESAQSAVERLISDASYTIDDAFASTAERADAEHATAILVDRVYVRLEEHMGALNVGDELTMSIRKLSDLISRLLRT